MISVCPVLDKLTERLQEVRSKSLCVSLMGNISWDFERFWTICSQEPMEKSCHLQVVVDLLFPLTGSAHQHAAITLLICLWHTRGSVILQWPCCGSRPAALLCTFYLSTAPITNFHGCLAFFPAVVRAFALKVGDPWSCHSSVWEYLNSINERL